MTTPSPIQPKDRPLQIAPIRCLVIQIARLGDTLQSLMALRAAKQLYPHLEIHFLARDRFASAAQRVPWIHKVTRLPTDQLIGPVIIGNKNETQALGDLARWIAPLVKNPWDFVVNWTFSESSSYLTALIPARIKLGYTRRRDSSFLGADGWSHFVQGIIQGKVHQNIHLTDVLTTQLLTALQIHIGEPLGNGNSTVTSKAFFSLALTGTDSESSFGDSSKNWISIQLGAAEESKTLDVTSWIGLIQYIQDRHPDYGIYLLGGKDDYWRAQLILQKIPENSRLLCLVGKTSFDLWASVISRSQWLFAADTSAIHLASVLGVRVLNISVGLVRFMETGPYGNGHYVMTSDRPCLGCHQESNSSKDHTCRLDISGEAIYSVWLYATQEWNHRHQLSMEDHFAQLGWATHAEDIRIYRSHIREASDGGGVQYKPVLKKPLSIEEWTGMVMGHLARAWYCGWLPPVGRELSRNTIHPPLIQKIREMSESVELLSKICIKASKTAETLTFKRSALKSEKVMKVQDRNALQEIGKTLADLDALIERVTTTHPPLKGFSQMCKVLMHHIHGTQLAELGKETADSYRQMNEGILIFRRWVRSTLDLAKPVVVKTASITSIAAVPPTAERDPST